LTASLEREYVDDWNSLWPIAQKVLGTELTVWNGNLYLSLDKDFRPMITGWIRRERDSETEEVALVFSNGKWEL